MSVENSPQNYCIITLFLNCALRLAELTNLNVEQVSCPVSNGNWQRR